MATKRNWPAGDIIVVLVFIFCGLAGFVIYVWADALGALWEKVRQVFR